MAVTVTVHPCSATLAIAASGDHDSIRYDCAPANSGRMTLVIRPVLWVIGDGPNWTSAEVTSRH